MLFNTFTFALFFTVIYSLFWIAPTWSARKWVLLSGSYLFYANWSPPYVALLFLSTSVDWWLARLVGRTENPRGRRLLLACSVTVNLALLAYFKYADFLLENFSALLGALGVTYRAAEASVILPVGISFYTFSSLSYTMDVYRREIDAECRFDDYALFVSFFPHLVAGPIIRAKYLLPQIVSPRLPTSHQIGWGLTLLCIGLFEKVVMADAIFAPVVDKFYAAPSRFGALDAWAAVLSFSGQIFYDFSGYSVCAIGLALCFGFSFPDNFNYPYGAHGFSDFWRRWHISLSSWLRDYLYIPLGGSRCGRARGYGNLMLVMLIGGLWHGASWMFVLWGALHGAFLALERLLRGRAFPMTYRSRPLQPVTALATFLLVSLTWIPFRASTLGEAAAAAAGLFRASPAAALDYSVMVALLAILVTVAWQIALRDASLESVIGRLRPAGKTALIAACLIALFLCSGGKQRAFIYFQF